MPGSQEKVTFYNAHVTRALYGYEICPNKMKRHPCVVKYEYKIKSFIDHYHNLY